MQKQTPKSTEIKNRKMPTVHARMGETPLPEKGDALSTKKQCSQDFATFDVAPKRHWMFSTSEKTRVTTPLLPKNITAPKVMYTPTAFATIQRIVDKSPEEVGWWGLVETVGNDYLITDIFIPEQTVCAVETDIQPPAMAALCNEIIDAGHCPSKLFFWGHSHVNMGVTPSMQDENQTDEYLADAPILIRGIYNKRGDSKVDVFDVANKVVFQCVETIVEALSEDEKTHIDELLLLNVTPRAPAFANTIAPPLLPKDSFIYLWGGTIVDMQDVLYYDHIDGAFAFVDGEYIFEKELTTQEADELFAILKANTPTR